MGIRTFASRAVAAVAGNTFFADISYYQRTVNSQYPYPILAFRADTGGSTDSNAAFNWAHCKSSAKIKMAIAYVVYIPGQNAAIMHRLKTLFGNTCPDKLVFMIDMESGSGFAGPGNHSTDANRLAELLAEYAGSHKRVMGYANSYDWKNCWPNHPGWMKRAVAAYSSSDPGAYSWQYYGGDSRWGSKAGYPRRCNPFGSSVDMNVIHKRISSILADFGIEEDWFAMATKSDLEKVVNASEARIFARFHNELREMAQALMLGENASLGWDKKTVPNLVQLGNGLFKRLTGVETKVDKLAAQVTALQAQVKGLQK